MSVSEGLRIQSNEGLALKLKMSGFKTLYGHGQLINLNTSADKNTFSCFTLPPIHLRLMFS